MPKCPYNQAHENAATPTREGAKYYAACPICGRKALAVVNVKVDGSRTYSLSRVGRCATADAKQVRSVRLSDSEMRAIERGALRLVVINNRITVSA